MYSSYAQMILEQRRRQQQEPYGGLASLQQQPSGPSMPPGGLSQLTGMGGGATAAPTAAAPAAGTAAPASGAAGAGIAPIAGPAVAIPASAYGLWTINDSDSPIGKLADNKIIKNIPYTRVIKGMSSMVHDPVKAFGGLPSRIGKAFGSIF